MNTNPWKKAFLILAACCIVGMIVAYCLVIKTASASVSHVDTTEIISLEDGLVTSNFGVSHNTIGMNLVDSTRKFAAPNEVQIDYTEADTGKTISASIVPLKINSLGAKMLVIELPPSSHKLDLKIHGR